MLKKLLFPILLSPAITLAIPSVSYINNSYSSNGKELAKSANKYIGVPYVWGGNSLTNGLDCSAFIKILVKTHTGVNLPRTAHNQALKTKQCSNITSFFNLQIGDAIYFKNNRGHIHHVALITGFDDDGYPYITHAKGKEYGVIREKITKQYVNEFFVGKRYSLCNKEQNKQHSKSLKYVPLLLKNM